MLCYSKQVNNSDRFQIPFGPISQWDEILVYYPNIANEMNGDSEENCLLFYYELSPVNGSYLFRDEDLENDFADILGMDLHTVSTGESKEDEIKRKEDEDDRSKSLQMFIEYGLTDDELQKIKDMGLTVSEYLKLSNENSIASVASAISDITIDESLEDYKDLKLKSKLAKKERRKKKIESRGN